MQGRYILPLMLCFPLAAHAVCSLGHEDGNTLVITYGSKDCTRNPEARAAFVRDLKAAVQVMDARIEAAERAQELRNQREQRLYNLSDLKHQARHLSGGARYYGQK